MTTPWRVPPMWQGRTVAVLASGLSMTAAVAEAVRAAGVPAVVTNDTFELAPWADMLVANDATWWVNRAQDALKFPGLKVSANDNCRFPQVLGLRSTGSEGFDPDPECVRTGGNSGQTAAHIVAQGCARCILLCGFDMRPGHWHRDHPKPLRNAKPPTYTKWIRRFGIFAVEMQKLGIEVLNCTPRSALKCFPFVSLENALAARAEPVSRPSVLPEAVL